MQLNNDTVINVAQLMKADVGETRKFQVTLDWFALDEDLMAKDVESDVRLIRVNRGILATGHLAGTALVECVRCLEIYEQPFLADFDHEYRPTIDVRSGMPVDQPDPDDEFGVIDEAHELNLAEPMRQVAILEMPIKPICRDACEGLAAADGTDGDDVDGRLSILGDLLETEDDTKRS